MTLAQAQSITGYELAIYHAPAGSLTLAVIDDNGELVTELVSKRKTCTKASKQIAQMAQEFVDWNYRRNCQAVCDAQKWRCANCGRPIPLEVHHKVFRSQGRDDRIENLVALCSCCHKGKHARQDRQ